MALPPSTVTIFGGGGFIGRHLVDELERRGLHVIIPATDSGARVDLGGPIEDIERAIDGSNVVVNAAGRAHIHSSDPSAFWPANATGAWKVAKAVAKTPSVKRLVHISSVAVGAGAMHPPVADYQPFTAYGAAKAAGEIAVAEAMTSAEADLVVVRPAGIGGLDSPGSWGTIRRLVEAGKRVPVPANDVRHDVVEIEEVVNFLVRSVSGDVASGAYALAGPPPVTLAEYAERVAALSGRTARLVRIPDGLVRSAGTVGHLIQRSTRTASRVESLVDTLTQQRPLVAKSWEQTGP